MQTTHASSPGVEARELIGNPPAALPEANYNKPHLSPFFQAVVPFYAIPQYNVNQYLGTPVQK
jgi:hypothetical protein